MLTPDRLFLRTGTRGGAAITPVLKEGLKAQAATLPKAAQAWIKLQGFDASPGQHLALPGPDGAVADVLFGAGGDPFLFGKLARALPEGTYRLLDGLAEAELACLGFLLEAYDFGRYKKTARPVVKLVCPAGVDRDATLRAASASWLARDLVNTPASDMGPDELEAAARAVAKAGGARVSVTRGRALETGFPMIHAVGRANPRAPRLIDFSWGKPKAAKVTLVGKGVCFDTGGLNIKPSSGMQLMKKDMGGAATVLGLAHMIMALGLPLRLRVLVPAVENSISGTAMRPKDILRSRKGLTVEVNDTDAEGRLVLGDALAYACEEPSDLLVSMATLTGAARVAVGPDLAPYYCDDGAVVVALEAGAVASFDPVWRLPFHTPYESVIEPGIADLDNAPGFGFAGSVTAALFLRRFVDGPRYLHFDIYGHTPADLPARPKGAVGQGARAVLGALPTLLGL